MKRRSISFVSLAAVAAAAAATAHAASVRTLSKESQIAIDGTSSVRSFTCEARVIRIETESEPVSGLLLPDRVKALVKDAQLEIATNGLDCGDATMTRHMYDALKAVDHPQIRFHITNAELGTAGTDSLPVKLHGELTLSGRTLPVTVSATATATPTGGVRLKGAHLLRMTEWSVKPPSLFFGTMKVGDSIVVRFDLAAEVPTATPIADVASLGGRR